MSAGNDKDPLHALAAEAGLALQWADFRNRPQTVDDGVLRAVLEALELPCASAAQCADSLAQLHDERLRGDAPLLTAQVGVPTPLPEAWSGGGAHRLVLEDGARRDLSCAPGAPLPEIAVPGYHRLDLADGRSLTLAVAPERGCAVADLGQGARLWGLAAQVYGLRREGDGGIGDFGAVAALADAARRHGADAIGLSPVHALYAAQPERYGPYAPSSRLALNPLFADPAAVFGAEAVRALIGELELGETFARLEAEPLVDWPAASRAKQRLFAALRERLDADSAAQADFRGWCCQAPDYLREHALFEALQPAQGTADWRQWPEALRDPRSVDAKRWGADHAEAVEHALFLQWLAARSLAAAQRSAKQSGMAIGLIGDLAVGTDAAGSHAWSRQAEILSGLRVGAPPDELGPLGQDWGLTAFSPRALRRSGYAAFIEMLRANLAHVGGLRIDHVLGLNRLWLIPEGGSAADGVYLHYPLTELLRLIALESWRAQAVIVGEDLGTVPEGLREQLQGAGVLGTRVLWFEREQDRFAPPQHWQKQALATTTTHDLPTVSGWWQGRDLDWRARLGLFGPDEDETALRAQRRRDRERLWWMLAEQGLVLGHEPSGDPAPVVRAAAAAVGRSACALALLPVEDALALDEQPNVPGTTEGHPNWQRRMPLPAATMLEGAEAAARLAALDEGRRVEPQR